MYTLYCNSQLIQENIFSLLTLEPSCIITVRTESTHTYLKCTKFTLWMKWLTYIFCPSEFSIPSNNRSKSEAICPPNYKWIYVTEYSFNTRLLNDSHLPHLLQIIKYSCPPLSTSTIKLVNLWRRGDVTNFHHSEFTVLSLVQCRLEARCKSFLE